MKSPTRKELLDLVTRLANSCKDVDWQELSQDDLATIASEVDYLILEAKSLLGQASVCSDCGMASLYIIGCPDGAEICQECFDAGHH